jgi:hypothetical protein
MLSEILKTMRPKMIMGCGMLTTLLLTHVAVAESVKDTTSTGTVRCSVGVLTTSSSGILFDTLQEDMQLVSIPMNDNDEGGASGQATQTIRKKSVVVKASTTKEGESLQVALELWDGEAERLAQDQVSFEKKTNTEYQAKVPGQAYEMQDAAAVSIALQYDVLATLKAYDWKSTKAELKTPIVKGLDIFALDAIVSNAITDKKLKPNSTLGVVIMGPCYFETVSK